MQERLKEIPTRVMEFWKRYSSKQKTIIIAVICLVLIAIGITAFLVSRPTYVKFNEFSRLEDASAMSKALDDQGIKYSTSNDGLTISVRKSDMTKAFYAMSDNNLVDSGYTWDKAFDNSMSTTESEKTQKRILALQNDLQKSLEGYSFIDAATVLIDVPQQTYSVLDEEEKTSVTALITVGEAKKKELTSNTAQALASWLANAVGTDVEHVVINDSDSNCVSTAASLGGGFVGGSSEYVDKLRETMDSNVQKLLIKLGYDEIQVGTQGIRFNMNKIETLAKTYSVAEGREYGYPTNLYTYKSEGGSGNGGEPGTNANDDDTDTMMNPGSGSSSSIDIEKLQQLLTNETIENIKQETPTIQYDESSLGIVALRYRIYDEAQLKSDGSLDNMTFEEFIAANNERTPITLNDDEVNLIAQATGVNAARISVMAYEVPKFVEEMETSRSLSDYLMIILAVLIIALLIYVVIRGTAPMKVSEEEPELSVEQLLATTKENQSLDDIEFSDKSETRKMIEKFVDENPEAVAQLLRNWLNDEWDM